MEYLTFVDESKPINPDKGNPQSNSLLFNPIPPEIRNEIFIQALTSYEDPEKLYQPDTYYTRPGYLGRKRVDIDLLCTCRRVYFETRLLLLKLNTERTFWCNRGPPGEYKDPLNYFYGLSPEQRKVVDRVNIFAQLYWLAGTFPGLCKSEVFRPKHLKITIRHSDWWFWENNTPLAMDSAWTSDLKELEGLEELKIELETIDRDKDQLEVIAKQMTQWRIPGPGQTIFTTSAGFTKRESWLGPSSFEGELRYDETSNSWVSARLWDESADYGDYEDEDEDEEEDEDNEDEEDDDHEDEEDGEHDEHATEDRDVRIPDSQAAEKNESTSASGNNHVISSSLEEALHGASNEIVAAVADAEESPVQSLSTQAQERPPNLSMTYQIITLTYRAERTE